MFVVGNVILILLTGGRKGSFGNFFLLFSLLFKHNFLFLVVVKDNFFFDNFLFLLLGWWWWCSMDRSAFFHLHYDFVGLVSCSRRDNGTHHRSHRFIVVIFFDWLLMLQALSPWWWRLPLLRFRRDQSFGWVLRPFFFLFLLPTDILIRRTMSIRTVLVQVFIGRVVVDAGFDVLAALGAAQFDHGVGRYKGRRGFLVLFHVAVAHLAQLHLFGVFHRSVTAHGLSVIGHDRNVLGG
mmetsp:Transcript_5786/g.14749  ORF Transcript_5786/g.14749 Transcript_5786/m.14749 type:complete len:237 (+) Transcript_5786:151-861(+)